MHGTSRVAIVAALLAAVALTACGTTVRVNGAQVDSKVPFLTMLESAWLNTSATDKYSQRAAETHCWLLREPDSGTLQPKALCGPIRHLRDDGKPGVFDEVEFTPQLVGDQEVTVDPDSIELGATGVEPPADLELYRPDGAKPVAADQVPQPAAPKAEPGVVARGDDGQIAMAGSPKAGTILAPGHKVSVTRFGPVDRLYAEGEIPFYGPADNEEFRALTITIEPQEFSDRYTDTSATYSIRSEGRTTDLKTFFEIDGGWGNQKADTKTIIVSVPKGKDAELVVGVGGLDQTISVRTGERTSTIAAANYRDKTEFGINKQFATQTVKEGTFRFQHGVTFTKAALTAFDGDKGWAPAGQMWLKLYWDNRTSQKTGDHGFMYEDPTFDLAKTLQITDADGKPAKIISGVPVSENYSNEPSVLVQLPETAKGIKVSYAPQGTFAADEYGAQDKSVDPKSGSFAFEPLTFEVTFS
ncbi:hypothetical protein [Microlunatus speluncae]|uniref:hypothetical protein n=1 Tax=Microlunatus speluncae TaxID=2594267 RepID=UPI0012667A70|nr:hypothetical protein [Microlunatus speluncae]